MLESIYNVCKDFIKLVLSSETHVKVGLLYHAQNVYLEAARDPVFGAAAPVFRQ